MTNTNILETLYGLISPLNKKDLKMGPSTHFATDLELDSLTVMDLVADIEDEFNILLPINMLPDLETIGDVANAVDAILKEGD